ncbi:MAG: hypothetical protein ACKO1K_07230 [Burkholderiales bacterium]
MQRLPDTGGVRKLKRRRFLLGYRWLRPTNDINEVAVSTTLNTWHWAQVAAISVC